MLRGTPGVQVIGNRVIIQGQSSISDITAPLYVVDGIPVQSINDVLPSMVENISVLKGLSAAIYGTRGIYGVILITLN